MCELCKKLDDFEKRLQQLEQSGVENARALSQLQGNITKPVLSAKEAGVILNMSAYTVSELCRGGKLRASQNSPEGPWRIRREAIEDYLTKTQKRA